MIGKKLCYGIDWKDGDQVMVHPPEPNDPYWEVIIIREKYTKRIQASQMVVVYEDDKIVTIHY